MSFSKEQALIATIRQCLDDSSAIGDDCFYDSANRLAVTTDMLVEGTHFRLNWSEPEDIAWKAMAVNASDLASMGASPRHYLIALGLPKNIETPWVQRFYQSINVFLKQFGGVVVGGDLVYAKTLTVSVTAIGDISQNHAPRFRNTVNQGDSIVLIGKPGFSALGFWALETLGKEKAIEYFPEAVLWHLRPNPALVVSKIIQEFCEKQVISVAMMDTSDGLADAALQMSKASGTQWKIQQERLKLHPEMEKAVSEFGVSEEMIRHWQLYGGEDFGLLLTAESNKVGDLVTEMDTGFWVSEIGTVSESDGESSVKIFKDQTLLEICQGAQTFQHF